MKAAYGDFRRLTRSVYIVSTKSHNQPVRLTKTVIDQATPPTTGQRFVRDTELKGFGLRITPAGTRTFVLEKRIGGRVRRITLGRYGELTVQQARQKAHQLLGQIAMGGDPVTEAHRARLQAITLGEAFRDFHRARSHLKPKTLYHYKRFMAVAFERWARWPLTRITKDKVAAHHRELGDARGEYYANGAMRFLRALFNFAIAAYEDSEGRPVVAENPVLRLTRTRSWYRSERRRTLIKRHELPAWGEAVASLRESTEPPYAPGHGDTVADYLLVLLFTGLRRTEALELRWADIDLTDRTLTIPDPKNRQPHTLPLSPFVLDLLQRRREATTPAWVFPGRGPKGHLVEPKKPIKRVAERAGITFTAHDLRRTFATVAESLDVGPYVLKRLMNHTQAGDVTAGYIVSDVERLRGPLERIDRFFQNALQDTATNVVALRTAAHEGE